MKTSTIQRIPRRAAHTALLVLVLASPSAWSAKAAPMSAEDAVFQKERAVCLSGQSNQDRATCLSEAGAARATARAGRLENESALTLAANAMRRCQAQPKGEERAACESKVRGEGQVSGTAAGGGVLKTMTTIEQPTPAPEKSTSPAVPSTR